MPKVYAMILGHDCAHLLPMALEKIPREHVDKVFLTDDGSKDDTVAVARSLGLDVTITNRSGYGANVKNGLEYAFGNGADYVVEVHGDGAQFHPKALNEAAPLIARSYDFIIGSRFIDKRRARELGMPLPRYIANITLSMIDRLILRLPFTEFHTGFRIYGPAFKKIDFRNNSNGYLFSFEIMAQAAYWKLNCAEVHVECDYHQDHTSHGYAGATVYAMLHFVTLAQFLFSTWTRGEVGVFKKSKS